MNTDSIMRAARNERSEQEQQFMIPRPVENSWGKGQALNKERIIKEFCTFTPVMNKKRDQECMEKYLDIVKVKRVQDPGLTPFGEFLPRSAPLMDYLSIGLHSGAGWKYPSAQTIHGIQAGRGLSYQMLKEVEVKEIIAGKSSPEEILEITRWMENDWRTTDVNQE